MTDFIKMTQHPLPEIMGHFNKKFGHLRMNQPLSFPSFQNSQSVACFSDYSGDHDSTYQSLNFLIVDSSGFKGFLLAIKKLKERRWKDPSYMQFKNLNQDKVRGELLPEFLEAANYLNGLAISFLVHRDIQYLFGKVDGKSPQQHLEEVGLGYWKKSAERLLRILHLNSFLIAGLVPSHCKVFWQTDRDPITEDPKEEFNKLGEALRRVLSIYCTQPFALLGYAKKFAPTFDNWMSHLLSIPDLVGGALTEMLNNTNEKFEGDIQEKTVPILKWFSGPTGNLKKLVCRIDPDENPNAYKIAFLNIGPPKY